MCGIGFVSAVDGTKLDSVKMTVALLTALEARGTDASGYGWQDEAGSWFVKSAERGKVQAKRLQKGETVGDARSIIVHTRYATLGTPEREENNHPLIRPGVMVVHNGVVRDHRYWTDRLHINRTAEVDSEVLAAVIETHGARDAMDIIAGMQGTAAIAWLQHDDAPGVVHAARIAGSPLVIGQTLDGDTIGASTELLLRKACGAAGVALDWVHHVQPGTYLRIVSGVIADWHRFTVRDMPTTTPNYRVPSLYARGLT